MFPLKIHVKSLGRVKVICRFWGRSEVAVVKSPGLRVCKISADSINSMLVFFEAAMKNIKKWTSWLVCHMLLLLNFWFNIQLWFAE